MKIYPLANIQIVPKKIKKFAKFKINTQKWRQQACKMKSPETFDLRHLRQTGVVFVAGPNTATLSNSISSNGEMSLVATKCRPNDSETSILKGRQWLDAMAPFLAPPR